MRQQQIEQLFKVMGPWNRLAEFLQQCLEIFFNGLLAMKANHVIHSVLFRVELTCSEPVCFGLFDPRRGFFLQTERLPFP